MLKRRHLLCCGGLAGVGLFSALAAPETLQALQAYEGGPVLNPCKSATPTAFEGVPPDWLAAVWDGLDPSQLWDVHAHLLGTGDSGSGCWVDPRLSQWWHPVEHLRKRMILNGACVPMDSRAVDRAYVNRLTQLADAFPAGARWLLFAFDEALDDAGTQRRDWTTFHVPDRYAREIATQRPDRFGWVASIHPYREDALERLEHALSGGALAIKWLPSSMNIDLRHPRLLPFYQRLAAARIPLIVHVGEEHAVPGAGRQALGNPLHLRAPLSQGVRVIAAHCASLGTAMDLDLPRPRKVPAFDLFARLMDEPAWSQLLLGDVSALFQFNRSPEVWHTVLRRENWHARLLHGSDYPLPGVMPLVRLPGLVRAGVLDEADVAPLDALRRQHPLLFDLALKRRANSAGHRLPASVFATAGHWAAGHARAAPTVAPDRGVSDQSTDPILPSSVGSAVGAQTGTTGLAR
ncbi:mannonate dehydratase [Roseateles sp. YR242]|uniref:amidohydrolase family protein n=1 Tax=Roseateles sp. YR242 TaxID=1855305 RepID=UPI0008CA18F7|nr:amidohydrolase family protein [Roseateles sp. YR242]SEK84102.1 mannonate dehydratase [Roseateles sp. YR242]